MSVGSNLEDVLGQIADAAEQSGRDPGEVRLVAVSKTWPVEKIEEAVAAGQIVFGENKVQEILAKVPAMDPKLEWHLIGHLQKNKTRKVLPLCAMIHSVDSVELARQIDRIAGELSLCPEILLQVNVAGDSAKFGLGQEVASVVAEEVMGLPNLSLRGLMTVPAFEEDIEKVRPAFSALRELRDRIASQVGAELPELSMGMSHDFPIAIEEGATLVRVGSSIFGQRDYSK